MDKIDCLIQNNCISTKNKMSIINTFVKDDIVIETRDCGEGVISVKTIYMNENERFVERIILPNGNIIINTTGIKQQIIIPIVANVGRPSTLSKEKQKLRSILLKRIGSIKKENGTSFPKREDYIDKTNDELLKLIDLLKKLYIEPIDKALLDILEFKKKHNLRLPLKKTYAKLPVLDLEKLLLELTNKINRKMELS